MTRSEYNTQSDKTAVKDYIRLFNCYFLPKRNTYHNRGEFFWTKQTEAETSEDFWRKLIEIVKECSFEGITAENLLISKFMTAITDTAIKIISRCDTIPCKIYTEIICRNRETSSSCKENLKNRTRGKNKTNILVT